MGPRSRKGGHHHDGFGTLVSTTKKSARDLFLGSWYGKSIYFSKKDQQKNQCFFFSSPIVHLPQLYDVKEVCRLHEGKQTGGGIRQTSLHPNGEGGLQQSEDYGWHNRCKTYTKGGWVGGLARFLCGQGTSKSYSAFFWILVKNFFHFLFFL